MDQLLKELILVNLQDPVHKHVCIPKFKNFDIRRHISLHKIFQFQDKS